MVFWIFGLLCLARSCTGVLIDGVDCSQNCACCKGGMARCGYNDSIPVDEYCFDGCVDGAFGWRCYNPCIGNCYTCEQINGRQCYSCKDTFYDVNSLCSKSCSVGCSGGVCDVDGTCSTCTAHFEGPKCETCTQGKYGSECTLHCDNQNCRCSIGTDCITCKSGFHGRMTFCQTPCSQGCQDSVCNDDGSCNCRGRFTGITCSECQSGYYAANCNVSCSVGCENGLCSKDGTCSCLPNFVTANCDTCADGRYGEFCDQVCSVGCTTSSCNKRNGFCECLYNFHGDKCDQCKSGLYGQNCELHCSDNCKGDTCSRDQGKCTHGCVDRYSYDNCTISCDNACATCLQIDESECVSCLNGYSGSTCQCLPHCYCDVASDVCTSCVHGFANPEKQCKCQSQYCIGTECDRCINLTFYVDENTCCECPENCKDGVCKSGPICTSGCIDGFYGIECSQSCLSLSADCLRCIQSDGKCLECNDGFYAHRNGSCIRCSRNCKNKQCNSETGTCTNGCAKRFLGDKCEIQCGSNCVTCQLDSGVCLSCTDTTYHGLFCNKSCSTSCLDSKCEQMTGYCHNGCSRDSFGSMCDIKCPDNCQQGDTKTRCNIDGSCLYGCINGLEGRICTERRIYLGSTTIGALAVLSGVLGILLICTATGCYLWNRRMSKSIEHSLEIHLDQREIERAYEQLQRKTSGETNRNIDDTYAVLSI
ncbi:cell death abnormality protein 1-like isoform X2 [Mya arenaria]|nr:cell death abnormality protein 1-like isoform X2 [Mya arenaria]